MRTTHVQTDFSAGELSSKFDGRLDIPQYYRGASILENFIVLPSGGIMRRPGSVEIGESKDTNPAHLIPFIIDSNTTFMLECGNSYMRFWHGNHTQMNNNGTPVEISTPWNSSQVYNVKHAQRIDGNNVPAKYMVHPGADIRKITYANSNFASANGNAVFTDPNNWFNGSNNWPSSIALAGGRMWLAGTNSKKQTLYGSVTLDQENFTSGNGTNNTDAFTFDVESDVNDQMRWLAGKNDIIAGTLSSEWRANIDITPSSPYIRKQTGFGSADIQALVVGDRLMFVQRDKKRIRDYYYLNEASSYQSRDLTWFADHVSGNGIVGTAFMQSPFPCLWAWTTDGELIGLTYERDADVIAWHRHPMNGTVKSVAIMPTSDGPDEVWCIVNRTINNSTKQFIEYFTVEEPSDQRDYVEVDCSKLYDYGDNETINLITKSANATITLDGTTGFNNNETIRVSEVSNFNNVNGQVFMLKNKNNSTFDLYDRNGTFQIDSSNYGNANAADGYAEKVVNTLGNLTYLNGHNVSIVADGGAHANKTVTANNVSLDGYFNTLHVGLPYNSTVRTMRIESQGVAMRQRRIHRVRLRFHNSLGAKFGPDEDTLETIVFRNGTDVLGTPPALFSGDKESEFPGKYDHNGYVIVKQEQPLPCTVLDIAVDMAIGEG